MDTEQDRETEKAPFSKHDRELFWKKKWREDNKLNMVIGFVFSPVLILILRWRSTLELSPVGWIIGLLLFWTVDLYYFNRRMNDYVRCKLIEEQDEDEDDPLF